MYGTVIIKNDIRQAEQLLQEYKSQIDSCGNLFIVVRNEYKANGDVELDLFDVIDTAIKSGYVYVNTIVVPTEEKISPEVPDNVVYVVWLALHSNHFFNKDAIRESHIWKDVEWGQRAKNYNPLGKDPGNVWIPTIDDGKAHITEHVLLSFRDIVTRIYDSTVQPNLEFVLDSNNKEDSSILPDCIKFVFHETCVSQIAYTPKQPKLVLSPMSAITGKVEWGSSESMNAIPDNSIDVVITSPPYWDLKDYFKKGQIGQEPYQTYLDRLNSVWSECYKKLTPSGSLWLNINIRVKDSHVVLIPRDFIKQCREIGFHYKGVLIWHKSSGIPVHARNIVDRFEFVLIFSKSKELHLDYRINEFADYKNPNINGGLFWNINRKAGSVGKKFIHPAIYPNQLVERIVEITTDTNQTVLDPFLGSGTSLIAALTKGRSCIGYEYNEGFKELIKSRIQNEVRQNVFTTIIL